MERILARGLGHVLVGANTSGFESLRRELLILIGDEVGAEGELVDVGTLTTEIEDTDLLGERLDSFKRQKGGDGEPWGRGHHGCTYSWGRACSCSSGSSGQVGVPFFL